MERDVGPCIGNYDLGDTRALYTEHTFVKAQFALEEIVDIDGYRFVVADKAKTIRKNVVSALKIMLESVFRSPCS